MTFDALVLAGGEGRRLGRVSKPDVVVAGRSLLDRALDATVRARRVVVVGPPALARPGVTTVLEEPPSGGPVAGIDAGLAALDASAAAGAAGGAGPGCPGGPADVPVLVVACDVPRAGAAVDDLLAALATGDVDGAHLVDADGRPQLVAVYRRAALRRALSDLADRGGVHGVPLRALHAGLVMASVPDPDDRGADADTWDDVRRLDALLTGAASVRPDVPTTHVQTSRAAPRPDRREPMDAPLPDPVPTDPERPDAGPPDVPEVPGVPQIPDLPDVPAGAGAGQPVPRGSDLHRWIVSVGDTLGVDPAALDVDTVLDLARDVAHSVARPAVPLTTFLAGYAVASAGGDRDAFDRVVDRIGALAAEWAAAVQEGEDPGAAAGSVPPAL